MKDRLNRRKPKWDSGKGTGKKRHDNLRQTSRQFPKGPSRTKNTTESEFRYGEKFRYGRSKTLRRGFRKYYGFERHTIFSTEGSFGLRQLWHCLPRPLPPVPFWISAGWRASARDSQPPLLDTVCFGMSEEGQVRWPRMVTGAKSTRKNPPKIKTFIWTSFSEEFPLGSWLVSQRRRQKFARTVRKSSR